MQWPDRIGVMVLPNVIMFPQAILPLYIFEARYRRMLADALASHRLFCVAMQHHTRRRESPAEIAGIGLIRVAREHADGTSQIVLQGLTRVELGPALRYRPYRTHAIRILNSQTQDNATVDALTTRLLELVAERIQQHTTSDADPSAPPNATGKAKSMEFLAQIDRPEQIADLISWALLSNPSQRQLLLETLDVETRLRRLIHFLTNQPPGLSEA